MTALEAQNEAERRDAVPQAVRLRAIAPEVGRFLVTVAMAAGSRTIVEIGTSGGYSTLWLALAAERTGGRVTTFEPDPAKVARARRTFEAAGLASLIDLRQADGGAGLSEFGGTADLVFIDAEKDDYPRLFELAIPALRRGGLLVADNLISHASQLETFRRKALADERVSAVVVPLGGGELVATKL